jgi:hypothetical protein
MSGEQNRTASMDLGSASPEEFARLVCDATAAELAGALREPELRTRVLDEVFSRMSRRYRGGPVNGVIHWQILDRPDGGHDLYENVLSHATCTVHRQRTGEPRVTISLSGTELLKLATGEHSPTVMFFSGRLRLTGDIRFAATVGNLFGAPTT